MWYQITIHYKTLKRSRLSHDRLTIRSNHICYKASLSYNIWYYLCTFLLKHICSCHVFINNEHYTLLQIFFLSPTIFVFILYYDHIKAVLFVKRSLFSFQEHVTSDLVNVDYCLSEMVRKLKYDIQRRVENLNMRKQRENREYVIHVTSVTRGCDVCRLKNQTYIFFLSFSQSQTMFVLCATNHRTICTYV